MICVSIITFKYWTRRCSLTNSILSIIISLLADNYESQWNTFFALQSVEWRVDRYREETMMWLEAMFTFFWWLYRYQYPDVFFNQNPWSLYLPLLSFCISPIPNLLLLPLPKINLEQFAPSKREFHQFPVFQSGSFYLPPMVAIATLS